MIKKNIKLTEFILILLFFLVIFSPAVGTLLGLKNVVSESENRNLNKIPQFNFHDQSFADYTKKLEAFLNDHFGFRNNLIELNNNIVISLFNKSPVKKVLIGKEGWLYYWNKSILENYYGMRSYNDRQIKAWIEVYEKRRLWLKERGIDFAFVIAPNKMTIYPEYLPRLINTDNHITQLKQLVTILKEKSAVKVVDLRPPLIAAKPLNQLYYKTDTHWNYYGAFEAYKYTLKEVFPGLSPMCFSTVSHMLEAGSKIDDKTGDLIHMLKGKNTRYPKFHYLEKTCAQEVDYYNIMPDHVGVKPPEKWEKGKPSRYLFVKACKNGKHRAIVFRDSFFSAVEGFFSEHFEVVVYVRKRYDPTIMEYLIEKINPDIVIEQIVERSLGQAPLDEIKFYEQDS
ncbi:MAG: hypothetical protein JW973_12000 [Bacteroidales bacterium]|nr:hypothetical protein [Bacteroidales bacterium]